MNSKSICRGEQEIQPTEVKSASDQKECSLLCDEIQECRFYTFHENNACRLYKSCDYPYSAITNKNTIYKKVVKGN